MIEVSTRGAMIYLMVQGPIMQMKPLINIFQIQNNQFFIRGVNDGYGITSPVGMFPKGQSPVGALDMAGNVTEWIYDSEYGYTTENKINPIAVENNGIKMQKAGFWAGSAGRVESPRDELLFGHNIRSDARQGDALNSADDHLGFRIGISYVERE